LSLTGVIFQVTYRLRRHFWLGWSLARWFGALLVSAGLAALIRWWWYPWPAIMLGGLFLVCVLILGWAGRRRYVQFKAVSDPRDLPPVPPLRAEELVPIRASGWFTVEGKVQYYADVEADFETVGTREHIVLGRVHPSRFLALGCWPEWELGWWYIFFQPAMIRKLAVGHLRFGRCPRPALQVVYTPDEKTLQTIYLAVDDSLLLQRLRDDLARDAIPNISGRSAVFLCEPHEGRGQYV
jgi:hypothetical protein